MAVRQTFAWECLARTGWLSCCLKTLLTMILIFRGASQSSSFTNRSGTAADCCSAEYSPVDCTAKQGAVYNGLLYTCVRLGKVVGTCRSCLELETGSSSDIDIACFSCCVAEEEQCSTQSGAAVTWAAYTTTVVFLSACCCCSMLCAFTENRRKRKGMTFAQAYSLPEGVPIVRTTITAIRTSSGRVKPRGTGAGGTGTTPAESDIDEEKDALKDYPIAGLVTDDVLYYAAPMQLPPEWRMLRRNSSMGSSQASIAVPQSSQSAVIADEYQPIEVVVTMPTTPPSAPVGAAPSAHSREAALPLPGPVQARTGTRPRGSGRDNDLSEPLFVSGASPTGSAPPGGGWSS